jgi:predicted PurR-regulated permease PerM
VKSNRFTLIFLSVLSVAAACLVVAIFWPFLKPLLFAAILGIGLYPLQAYLLRYVRSRSAAATLSTLAVLLIIVLPAAMTIASVSGEMVNISHLLAAKSREQGGVQQYVMNVVQIPLNWLGRHVDLERSGIQQWLDALPTRASGILLRSATFLVSRLAGFAGQTIITFFVLFFIFRDGPSIADKIASILPLSDDQTQRLFASVRDAIVANFYGILAVAIVQGVLNGIALTVLRGPAPLMLGVLTGFASLVPLVGTALVWVPTSIYLMATGPIWKGIALILWGTVFVGSADNIVRPLVVQGRIQMHPLILMFAILGGLDVFGFLGIFIGPMALSVIVALGELLRDELRRQRVEINGVIAGS